LSLEVLPELLPHIFSAGPDAHLLANRERRRRFFVALVPHSIAGPNAPAVHVTNDGK